MNKDSHDINNTTKVYNDEFINEYLSAIPIDLFTEIQRRSIKGYNYSYIPNDLFNEIKNRKIKDSELQDLIQETARLNNLGSKAEKNGNIEKAIEYYEICCSIEAVATNSYERLMIIYRQNKDYKNEIRIIELAINIFTIENKRRAELATDQYPKFKDNIQNALDMNESFKDSNGRFIFNPYDTLKYISRLEKAWILYNKTKC